MRSNQHFFLFLSLLLLLLFPLFLSPLPLLLLLPFQLSSFLPPPVASINLDLPRAWAILQETRKHLDKTGSAVKSLLEDEIGIYEETDLILLRKATPSMQKYLSDIMDLTFERRPSRGLQRRNGDIGMDQYKSEYKTMFCMDELLL